MRRLLLTAVLAVAVTSAPGSVQAGIEREPQFVDDVDNAIERGVAWLVEHEDAGGGWVDYPGFPGATTALTIYTLRVCGVEREHPVLARAYRALRDHYSRRRKGRGGSRNLQTYGAALYLMAIAEQGKPRTTALSGGCKLEDADREWMEELVDSIERTQRRAGGWHYADGPSSGEDHSNSQYALLGLRAASESGVKVKERTYHRALRHFVATQDKNGPEVPRFEPGPRGKTSDGVVDTSRGWSYTDGGEAYGSMTAGAIASLVICRSQLLGWNGYAKSLDDRAERAIRDGVAWLGHHFSAHTNPGPRGRTMAGPRWLYYYLYAVERAGILAGVDWMGVRDWYGEGARFLLGEQEKDGRWRQTTPIGRGVGPVPVDDVLSTCFALLFLKKGTLPVRRGALTAAPDEKAINWDAAAKLQGKDFEDFVDLVISRYWRVGDSGARERLVARAARVGPRIVVPLLVRMDSTQERTRRAAFAILERATGLRHDYDPLAPAARREDAILRWQAWWFANQRSLRYDLKLGRLVSDR